MMANSLLIPFIYGKPVPWDHFIGREGTLQLIFSNILNGQSTAVVGEPHMGKSSVLQFLNSERARAAFLPESARRWMFIDLDCHNLNDRQYQPANFWKQVLDDLALLYRNQMIHAQIELVRQSDYQNFALLRLFEQIGRKDRRVVLLLDEFDTLLDHPNFSGSAFFATLRAISSNSAGLVLVTATRLELAEMNRRTQNINPTGSPYFNTLNEIPLHCFSPDEIARVLDHALSRTVVTFSEADRDYIRRTSGGHPFLVQAAAAALYQAIGLNKLGRGRHDFADRQLLDQANVLFNDLWSRLQEGTQAGLHAMAQIHVRGQVGPAGGATAALSIAWSDLKELVNTGLVEETDRASGVLCRDKFWRISAESFSRWITEHAPPPMAPVPPRTPQQEEQIGRLGDLVKAHLDRLYQLQLKEARLGANADASVAIEIHEIEQAIAALKQQIQELSR
jgi:AAA domain